MDVRKVEGGNVDAFLETDSVPMMHCSRTTVTIFGGFVIVMLIAVVVRAIMACAFDDSDLEEFPGDEEAEIEDLLPYSYEYLDDDYALDEEGHGRSDEKLRAYEEGQVLKR